jgi:transposase
MNEYRRHELTDEQWARIVPLLPPERPATGRPAKDHRLVVNAILWRIRSGAAWRDLPSEYGPWETIYSRFRRWRDAGIWDELLVALQTEAAHDDQLDGTLAMLDGSNIRAHQAAAGARKKGVQETRRSVAAGVAGARNCTS